MKESKEESRQRKIKYQLQNDRAYFFCKVLRHYIKTDTLGSLHKEWFELLENESKLGIVAPRGHAKSTIINVADNLFDICNNGLTVHQPYIVIFSDTPEQAVEHLGAIVEELEGNPIIHEYYGHLYEGRMVGDKKKDKWTQASIITSNGVKVEAKGWRSRTRGMRWKQYRPTKIVIDDIENDEDVYSPTMREKLRNTFEKKILNLGEPETKYRFVGTILHYDSLLNNEYIKPRICWTWRFYKAIKNDETPLWSEWWTMDRLMAKKEEIGIIPFEQEFQNNPIDPSTQIIRPVAFYDVVDTARFDYYGYIDPAISETETADYTALCTIGRNRDTGKMYVVDPIKIRGSVNDILELIFKQYAKYRWVKFGCESVAFQKALAQWVRNESNKRGIYVPIIECLADKDKIRRVLDISPYIDNGSVIFNNNYIDFNAECTQFPKAPHDDFVDSLVGAVKLAIGGSGDGKILTGQGIHYNETSHGRY